MNFARTTFVIITLFPSLSYAALQDSIPATSLTFSGYLEVYYAYDFNKPANNKRPDFVYSYNRHNEVNANLGFIKVGYSRENVRSNLALMAGTYANANLAYEPGVLKNIYEANAGVRLSRSKNLWVDAGIFGSHIGFESAVGKDCWNLTRSILADNTPYYEAGVKVSYTNVNGKWFLSGMILNGWQRMQRLAGNSMPSFGTQVTFKPSNNVTLNSSTFIGTDTPDSARLMRYFHNFYGIFQVSKSLGLTVGFDYGIQQKTPQSSTMNPWFSPVVIARLALTGKAFVSVRGEYYQDQHGVIIASSSPNGFRTAGVSANFDYQLAANAVWRIEARNLTSKDNIFTASNTMTTTDTFVSTSLALAF